MLPDQCASRTTQHQTACTTKEVHPVPFYRDPFMGFLLVLILLIGIGVPWLLFKNEQALQSRRKPQTPRDDRESPPDP